MTTLATPIPDSRPVENHLFTIKLTIALALVALADFLFYDERIGLSVAIFAVAVMAGSLAANIGGITQRRALTATVVLAVGLVPAVEELNVVSFLIAVATLALAVAILTHPKLEGLRDRLRALRDVLLIGPFRLIGDVAGSLNVNALTATIAKWLVPLILAGVFLLLFAEANPLIENWLRLFNPQSASSHVNLAHLLFWTAVLSVVWPFINPKWWPRRAAAASHVVSPDPAASEAASPSLDFFGVDMILRALILFNLLFAVQTGLDLIYLWLNAKLPPGVNYADYAHRGAYALIVTALLAAAFVLAATRPGGPAEKSRVIRPLVYVWIAQNIMLVASSILRLQLYVEIYLLTYWRIAAFAWMGLVSIGLLLIVARIALQRSNGWLIRMNLVSLVATFYICALTNFAAIIADYNVSHSREAGGKGVNLDLCYLSTLGPQAIPAIDRAIQAQGDNAGLVGRRSELVQLQALDMDSWRSWSFRWWRLQHYLNDRASRAEAG
jgi:Domain of unknown function (DUF4173)